MRLVSLALQAYRQFESIPLLTFDPGLTGICGDNGVGKSKLIEAIGFALYGVRRPPLPKGDKKSDLSTRLPGARSNLRVELVFEAGGVQYAIERSLNTASIRVKDGADNLADTPSGVTARVIELLRLTPAAYHGTFVARQREIAGLQQLAPKARVQLVNRLIGLRQVDIAIDAARERLVEARGAVDRAEASGRTTVAAARTALEEQSADHREAVHRESRAQAELRSSQAARDAAVGALSALSVKVDAVEALRAQVRSLDAQIEAATAAHHRAQRRAEEAGEHARQLRQARKNLQATEGADAAVARWERLAERDRLHEERNDAEETLANRLRPGLEERDRLRKAIHEVSAQLEAVQKDRHDLARRRGLAESATTRAQVDQRHYRELRERALALGTAGTCEECGQVFGENLEHAVAHYATKEQQAGDIIKSARQEMTNVEVEETDLARAEARWVSEREERQAQLAALDSYPGEASSLERRVAYLDTQLAYAELASLKYDPDAHKIDIRRAHERAIALADVHRLETLANQEEPARAEVAEFETQRQVLTEQRDSLKLRIAREAIEPAVIKRAETAREDASGKFAKVEAAWRNAVQDASTLAERVAHAEADLVHAQERERAVARERRHLEVAQRTEEVLQRLRTEITNEARPRLAELMDDWGRALLGPRLQRIQLTDDYRIQADNGSGLHQLEHFSGGEQTLLALMLRVAISHFCRERAGLDGGVLVLDEIFGDQDAEHRALVLEFLYEIQGEYQQILLVNHVQDVTEMLDNIIDVTRTGPTTSTARMRH